MPEQQQHEKIKGYKTLTDAQIVRMNEIKTKGQEIGDMIERFLATGDDVDPRWLAIGKTQVQQGFMALTRGVTMPDFF